MKFSIPHLPIFLAFSLTASLAGANAWRIDPLGWVEDGTALESRSSGFALGNTAPAGKMEFTARVTPRSSKEESYGTVGIAAYVSENDFWCLSLVKGPDHAGARHFCELGPKTAGQWPAYGLFTRVEEKKGPAWNWNRVYDLSLRFSHERVEGEIRDAESGAVVYRTAFVPKGHPLLPSGAVPALRVTGRFKARVEAEIPPGGGAWHDTGVAVFPSYASVGPDTGIYGRATGFFHVEKIDGIDWAIDPVGRAIPITGIDHVKWEGFACEKLGGRRPYREHNEKTYPSRDAWADETLGRLRAWGFDMLAAGCDLTLLGHREMAHAVCLSLSNRFTFGDDEWFIAPNLHAPCTAFPNVFHPDYERACEWAAEALCAPNRNDPWLVGWFIDNELAWWGRSADRATGLFDLVAQKPDTHSAKKALLEYVSGRPVTREVKLGFLRLAAERYFSVTTAAIRKADPNHMILGCRFAGFAGAHEDVWEIAGKYCDVVSFNCYPWADLDRGVVLRARGGVPITGEFRRYHDLCRRPMIITEWSFPALDTGRPCYHGAGQRFRTQSERTAATELFARTMLAEPYFIGYDYFMWLDQPALGLNHWFPEDSNYGLVQENGEPHRLITDMFTRLHAGVAALRTATSNGRGVTRDERKDTISSGDISERERFFAAATKSLVTRHSSPVTPSSVGFASEADGRWSLSNGLVRLSGRKGGTFMAETIAWGEGTSNPVAGRFRALLQWNNGARTLWTDTERVTDISFARDEATGIVSATIRAEGEHDDTSRASVLPRPSSEVAGSPRWGAEGGPLFAITARLSLAPGNPDILAELLSAENMTSTPIEVERIFMRPYAAVAKPSQSDSVPNLWKGPLEDWWLLPDGHRFGISSHDDSAQSFSLWIKDDGVQHPDARFTDGAKFTIAPWATWRPAAPMGALLKYE